MRVRDLVSNLRIRLADLPENTPNKEELELLCWVASDSELPLIKNNIVPFIDFLNAHHHNADAACAVLADSLVPYIEAPQISSTFVWDLPTLLAAMSNYPTNKRVDVLANFNIATLSKLILNGKDFRTTVNNQEHYIGDEDHARTVLMAFGYYYHELTRNRAADYKHLTGSWTGYDAATKLKGINLVLKFLESGDRLANFEKFLDSDDCKGLKKPMLAGELGDISKMITYVSKKENREIAQPKGVVEKITSMFGWR